MNLGEILFYSEDTKSLSRYIQSLFDLEAVLDDDIIRIEQSDVTFAIKNRQLQSSVEVENNMVLDFHVASMDELSNFLEKIQFYYYRLKDEFKVEPDVPEIVQSGNVYFCEISDPDGRVWRFSYRDLQ